MQKQPLDGVYRRVRVVKLGLVKATARQEPFLSLIEASISSVSALRTSTAGL
jgi:hypothetical protein